jgi:hypothetical protein
MVAGEPRALLSLYHEEGENKKLSVTINPKVEGNHPHPSLPLPRGRVRVRGAKAIWVWAWKREITRVK